MATANRFEDMLAKAHEASMGNRDDIKRSGQCGCYYCGSVFSKDEINEWIEDVGGDTALRPRCGIDAVVGDASVPFTPVMPSALNIRWFGEDLDVEAPRGEVLAQFEHKWSPRFQWRPYNMLFETMEFAEDCGALGFKMDCGEAFTEAFPGCFRDAAATEAAIASCEDVDLLGSALHSGWRYYNHWNDSGAFELDEHAWFGVCCGGSVSSQHKALPPRALSPLRARADADGAGDPEGDARLTRPRAGASGAKAQPTRCGRAPDNPSCKAAHGAARGRARSGGQTRARG